MGSTEQHYSLRWNDYTVKIVTAFQSLRDEEDFVDVTVACDGHHYSAHKMVLSACSPYFRSILRMNPCQHPIVILKDVGHVELERLLEFMYNGEVNIAQDQLAAFLKTAENLKIRGLAGSSEDMDQNKDAFHEFTNTNSGANNTGLTSGKSSPSVGFNNNIASIKDSPGYGPNIVSKDEEGNGTGNTLDSGISYSRIESPQSKRRKRNNAPATSHTDSNTSSHTPDGMVSESGVDLDGTVVTGNSLSMEEDLRMIERREMKPEPSDSLVTELGSDVSHQGDQLDQRPVMYPLGMAGPSSTPGVGSQENLSSQEPGVMLVPWTGRNEDEMMPALKTERNSGANADGRVYPCHDCEKVFRHPRSYYQHQHVHRGTHLCPGCRKLFSRRWDLMRHLNKNKYGCPARWRDRVRPSTSVSSDTSTSTLNLAALASAAAAASYTSSSFTDNSNNNSESNVNQDEVNDLMLQRPSWLLSRNDVFNWRTSEASSRPST